MADVEAVERVLAQMEPGNSLIDQHPNSLEIKALVADWALESESRRPPFTQIVADIVDRYAQDGSLGKDPEGALRRFMERHRGAFVVSRAWAMRGLLDGRHDLNLARQHLERAERLARAMDAVDPAEDPSGFASLARAHESALTAANDVLLTLGAVEDNRVNKSIALHHHEHVERQAADDVMSRVRGRPKPIDATSRRAEP